MIIDIHTHIVDLRSPAQIDRVPVTCENLIARLDEEGIDRAVVLPLWASPEGIVFPYLLSANAGIVEQINQAARFADRLIPFGNLEPRMGGNTPHADFSWILERFVEMGCVGIGEVTAHLDADDPRAINMCRQCGQWALPVLLHVTGPGEGHYGLIDQVGSYGLERLLREAPNTALIGHGQGFWSEVSGDLTLQEKSEYPAGPIAPGGSLPRLLRTCSNLYADISGRSGHNALIRDESWGIHFLREFQDRVLFGTDVCFGDAQGRMPHLGYLRSLLAQGHISQPVFDKVTSKNALSILKQCSVLPGSGR